VITKELAPNWYMAKLGKAAFFNRSREIAEGRLLTYIKQKKVDSVKLAENITESLDVL
jgi:hypothetical protein